MADVHFIPFSVGVSEIPRYANADPLHTLGKQAGVRKTLVVGVGNAIFPTLIDAPLGSTTDLLVRIHSEAKGEFTIRRFDGAALIAGQGETMYDGFDDVRYLPKEHVIEFRSRA